MRVNAWRTRIAIRDDVSVWSDRFDIGARHWAFLEGDRPVAAGRLTVSARLDQVPDAEVYKGVLADNLPGPIASLTRLVIDPEYRGRGLAQRLDSVRIAAAKEIGCACVIGAISENGRFAQLKALGFEAHAAKNRHSEESGILTGVRPTEIMVLPLPCTTAVVS